VRRRVSGLLFFSKRDQKMAKSGSEGDLVIQRRVQVLEHLPATREELAEKLDCDKKTITRDLNWLRQNGVPLQKRKADRSALLIWYVANKFNGPAWFWRWGTGKASAVDAGD
jgi:predicted HTH transcriptional regulator